MKRLLVKPGKYAKAIEILKLLSNNNTESISVTLDRESDCVYHNIDFLNELLKRDEDSFDDNYSYKEEFEKIGLEVIEYSNNGIYKIKIKYSERLFEVCRLYALMILPADDNEELNEFTLMPIYIFPKEYNSYDDLITLVPELVNLLIVNDVAYIE